MSLVQELLSFPSYLNKKYNRTDMNKIVNKYCQSIGILSQEEMSRYVVPADKERFEQGNYKLNIGHVYTGIMYSEECFTKFENWFKEKYA